jgi:hypothetical protein
MLRDPHWTLGFIQGRLGEVLRDEFIRRLLQDIVRGGKPREH